MVSLITRIDYDHTDLLGETLPEIAAEKAGIIKPGVPVVIGTRNDAYFSVFIEKARAMQCDLVFAPDHYIPSYSTYSSESRRIFRMKKN